MELTPKEMMKQYVDSQNFTSTTEIMVAMKDMFRDALQQVMESELDVELGYEKSERMSENDDDKLITLLIDFKMLKLALWRWVKTRIFFVFLSPSSFLK